MGYCLSNEQFNNLLEELGGEYVIYGPGFFKGGGHFSDTDVIRYRQIIRIDDIVFDAKSHDSAKEALHAISETLFYFTENEVKESNDRHKKALVFLRSCDIHGLKRLDELFLGNGDPDYYYERARKNIRFVLMPCGAAFENCFCPDMKTNKTDEYHFSVEKKDNGFYVNCKAAEFDALFEKYSEKEMDVDVPFVAGTETRVKISDKLANSAAALPLWEEYDGRCINCGRCTFVCPSCSCWTMQDIFYADNGKVGERRRVWASCMIDGYADMAGGGTYRKKNGERMRFKVMHKIYNHKKRFGTMMCSGCGRCDDVCPEYISFSNALNKLYDAVEGGA
jgi:anaerobic sulfite reductase subunit A